MDLVKHAPVSCSLRLQGAVSVPSGPYTVSSQTSLIWCRTVEANLALAISNDWFTPTPSDMCTAARRTSIQPSARRGQQSSAAGDFMFSLLECRTSGAAADQPNAAVLRETLGLVPPLSRDSQRSVTTLRRDRQPHGLSGGMEWQRSSGRAAAGLQPHALARHRARSGSSLVPVHA
jgi:hypothetical protein